MSSDKLKHCPRCSTRFECTTGTVARCQCKTVQLRAEQLDFIAKHYTDCLCAQCLESMGREFDRVESNPILNKTP